MKLKRIEIETINLIVERKKEKEKILEYDIKKHQILDLYTQLGYTQRVVT